MADESWRPDFNSPAFVADPYPTYRYLLYNEPVHHSAEGIWYLVRHADVSRVFTDPRFGRRSPFGSNPLNDPAPAVSPAEAIISRWLLLLDPPEHTQRRDLLREHFTAKTLAVLRPRIEALAESLLDAAIERGGMDVIDDFAYPLPVRVIAAILGVPETDALLFRDWAAVLTRALNDGEPEDIAAADPTVQAMMAYFDALLRDRSVHEGLIGTLTEAEKQDVLRHHDLLATCILLLWAGHETTKNLIGNGLYLLIEHPDQQQALRRNPGLIESAVEEFLRYETPVQKLSRWSCAPCEFGDVTIPGDQFIVNLVGAANRDPAQFEQPDRFDITRGRNRHIGFGQGIHTCLGALLARTEAQIAIGAVLRRCAAIEPLIERVTWRPYTAFRSFASLPVAVRAA